jgi:hypothetical protein
MTIVTLTISPGQFSSTFAFIFIAALLLRNSQNRVLDSFDDLISKKPKRAFIPEKTGRLYDFVLMGAKARDFPKHCTCYHAYKVARSIPQAFHKSPR